jgi:hypothetical protein
MTVMGRKGDFSAESYLVAYTSSLTGTGSRDGILIYLGLDENLLNF